MAGDRCNQAEQYGTKPGVQRSGLWSALRERAHAAIHKQAGPKPLPVHRENAGRAGPKPTDALPGWVEFSGLTEKMLPTM